MGYDNKESACSAIVAVHCTDIDGQNVKCSWGKENPSSSNPSTNMQMNRGVPNINSSNPPNGALTSRFGIPGQNPGAGGPVMMPGGNPAAPGGYQLDPQQMQAAQLAAAAAQNPAAAQQYYAQQQYYAYMYNPQYMQQMQQQQAAQQQQRPNSSTMLNNNKQLIHLLEQVTIKEVNHIQVATAHPKVIEGDSKSYTIKVFPLVRPSVYIIAAISVVFPIKVVRLQTFFRRKKAFKGKEQKNVILYRYCI